MLPDEKLPPWPGKYGDPEKLKEWYRIYKRIKYQEDPQAGRQKCADWSQKNPGRRAAATKRYTAKLWQELLDHYGRSCACCGESDEKFLSLDHLNNDGSEHRRQTGGSGYSVWLDLRRQGWPHGFQILCFNCNLGRARNGGVCPHQEGVLRIVRVA